MLINWLLINIHFQSIHPSFINHRCTLNSSIIDLSVYQSIFHPFIHPSFIHSSFILHPFMHPSSFIHSSIHISFIHCSSFIVHPCNFFLTWLITQLWTNNQTLSIKLFSLTLVPTHYCSFKAFYRTNKQPRKKEPSKGLPLIPNFEKTTWT
jgi:hypothetical protein